MVWDLSQFGLESLFYDGNQWQEMMQAHETSPNDISDQHIRTEAL